MKLLTGLIALLFCANVCAQNNFTLNSPNNRLSLEVIIGDEISYEFKHQGTTVMASSMAAMLLEGGEYIGKNVRVKSQSVESINQIIKPELYRKSEIVDNYNQLTIVTESDYSIVYRMYNDGFAYRFEVDRTTDLTILDEEVEFDFKKDRAVFLPYGVDYRDGNEYQISFENNYTNANITDIVYDSLAFLPILADIGRGMKIVFSEADLEDYPGMFIEKSKSNPYAFIGEFANYPKREVQGGHNNLQMFVKEYEPYMAKTSGSRTFPWRYAVLSEADKDLMNNDMVYKLAAPSRLEDVSWVKPGKVAWDWWNDWNISGVDFVAGVNTETYNYYTDFAAEYGIENILLDEGWSYTTSLFDVKPEIDLEEIISHATEKGVGVWLWAGWLPLDKEMDRVCGTYADMGVKGFKVDFMDRDDQKMVNFYYTLAETAAKYNLMLDFHGAYKPTGLHRTYPNVVNYEGVRGLENVKWSNTDFPTYDVTIPFIRMLAGPMDYTPGAMLNATRRNFRSVSSAPMSQGTRCHQLGMYVLYDAPFNMLCDNPTNYMNESESTNAIASVPTVFEETVALDGVVGEFAAIARMKDGVWYIGALTNWSARDINLDLSFLGDGDYSAEIYSDGVNAHRRATDYKVDNLSVKKSDKLFVKMAPGGGYLAIIKKK